MVSTSTGTGASSRSPATASAMPAQTAVTPRRGRSTRGAPLPTARSGGWGAAEAAASAGAG